MQTFMKRQRTKFQVRKHQIDLRLEGEVQRMEVSEAQEAK